MKLWGVHNHCMACIRLVCCRENIECHFNKHLSDSVTKVVVISLQASCICIILNMSDKCFLHTMPGYCYLIPVWDFYPPRLCHGPMLSQPRTTFLWQQQQQQQHSSINYLCLPLYLEKKQTIQTFFNKHKKMFLKNTTLVSIHIHCDGIKWNLDFLLVTCHNYAIIEHTCTA